MISAALAIRFQGFCVNAADRGNKLRETGRNMPVIQVDDGRNELGIENIRHGLPRVFNDLFADTGMHFAKGIRPSVPLGTGQRLSQDQVVALFVRQFDQIRLGQPVGSLYGVMKLKLHILRCDGPSPGTKDFAAFPPPPFLLFRHP